MIKAYEPIYTTKEAAAVLKTGENYIRELMNTGKLPYIKMGERKIKGTDLELYINKHPVEVPEYTQS